MSTVLTNEGCKSPVLERKFDTQRERARKTLLETNHDLTSRNGILSWLSAVGIALTHDLEEMPRQKANTSAYVAAVSLKAVQS